MQEESKLRLAFCLTAMADDWLKVNLWRFDEYHKHIHKFCMYVLRITYTGTMGNFSINSDIVAGGNGSRYTDIWTYKQDEW
jgi:hypothetical protein